MNVTLDDSFIVVGDGLHVLDRSNVVSRPVVVGGRRCWGSCCGLGHPSIRSIADWFSKEIADLWKALVDVPGLNFMPDNGDPPRTRTENLLIKSQTS